MVDFQRPRRWIFGAKAKEERSNFLSSFPGPEQGEVFQRMVHHMVYLENEGHHPEELPRHRLLRAIPAYTSPERAMYLIFTPISGKYCVLKVANCDVDADDSVAAKGLYSRPPLSDEAWATAQDRLDSGAWQ
ncbi:UNVERIFIED_ORG: hypothetical protein J2X79_004293 [Arthrobacter globiformis]|nr:hypothetical protein [Arthrobacter globiformis]